MNKQKNVLHLKLYLKLMRITGVVVHPLSEHKSVILTNTQAGW